MWTDTLERPIAKGDYVVYYRNIYQVVDLIGSPRQGSGMACIKLVDSSAAYATRPVIKSCYEMCIIDKGDVLAWKLKRGY
jgi:hypothetical protein